MDEFDFKEERPKSRYRFGSALWNIASLIMFLGTLCAGAYFVMIFLYPESGLNPFPPFITATAQPPTATLEASPTATATENPTATPELPTPTLEQAGSSFQIQEGSPAALDASVFHPELACNFLGVAGQAFGLDDAPITGLRVQVIQSRSLRASGALGKLALQPQ